MNFHNSATNDTEKSTVLDNSLNLWEIPEKCEKCGFPMHLRSGGTIAFCPPCVAKAEQAMSGKAALERLKIRWAECEREKAAQNDPSRPLGYWPKGMPL